MSGERALWCAVLEAVILDALEGASANISGDKQRAALDTQKARDFILRPNRDFNILCAFAGMDPEAVRDRLRPKIEAAEARVKQARRPGRRPHHRAQISLTAFGVTKTITEWAQELGMSYHTLHARIRVQGLDSEEALTRP